MPSFAYIQRQTWVSMLLFETHDILNMYTHVNIDVSTLYEGEVCLANWLGPSLARIDYYAHCPGASMAWRGQQKRELKFRMYREHRQHKLLLRKLGRIHNWQTIATDSLGEKDRTWNKEKKKRKTRLDTRDGRRKMLSSIFDWAWWHIRGPIGRLYIRGSNP